MIPISASPTIERCRRGNFNAEVTKHELVVPQHLKKACDNFRIRDAARLINQLYEDPVSFADELGWTTRQVLDARNTLNRQLRKVH